MKSFKNLSILMIVMSLFSNCSSAQKLQKKAPVNYDGVFWQKWVAGIQGGGSGINLFIPTTSELSKSIQLDSVYFHGKVAILEKIEGEKTLYVGRFKINSNQKQDIIMSSDPNEEYGNQTPILEEKTPFELKDSECVISYKEGNATKYFKIENIVEKQQEQYPSMPNKQ